MTGEEEGFKITDRRHRAAGDDAPEAAPSIAPPPAPGGAPEADDLAGPGALDLRAVFTMFAGSALMGLGEADDPATGERHLDLAQAEEAIDVLILLREKTQGNRTPDESAFLDDVLYDLQVRFVQVTQGPGA